MCRCKFRETKQLYNCTAKKKLVVVGAVNEVAVTVFTCDDGGYLLLQADDQSACVLVVVMKTLVAAHSRRLSSLLLW